MHGIVLHMQEHNNDILRRKTVSGRVLRCTSNIRDVTEILKFASSEHINVSRYMHVNVCSCTNETSDTPEASTEDLLVKSILCTSHTYRAS